MKVRIFGYNLFESKWVPKPRGWLNHHFLCDGHIAVHDTWIVEGYHHGVIYDHTAQDRAEILDWCQSHAPRSHILHPSGAVLFKEQERAEEFRSRWI